MEREYMNQLYDAEGIINNAFSWYDKANKQKVEIVKLEGKKIPGIIYVIVSIAWIYYMTFGYCILSQIIYGHPREGLSILLSINTFFVPCLIIRSLHKRAIRKKQKKCWKLYDENILKGASILKENEKILSIIPERYQYPMAISHVIMLFDEGRTDYMNDALDRFDLYRYQTSVEAALKDINLTIQLQNRILHELRSRVSEIMSNTAKSA